MLASLLAAPVVLAAARLSFEIHRIPEPAAARATYARGLVLVCLVSHRGQCALTSPSQDHLRTRKAPKFTTDVRNLLPPLRQGVSIPTVLHAGSYGSWPDLCNPICKGIEGNTTGAAVPRCCDPP